MAEGFVMLTSEMAAVVTEVLLAQVEQQHRFELVTTGESLQVLLNGDLVADLSIDGRFRVLLGDYETSLFAYEDDEQDGVLRKISSLLIQWADGELIVERRRGILGGFTYWAELTGYRQQFLKRQ